jgi:hypothetical protein
MRIPRKTLEAAARCYLAEMGFEYHGKSIIDCAESKDPKVYNPRAAKAVDSARKILQAAARSPQENASD